MSGVELTLVVTAFSVGGWCTATSLQLRAIQKQQRRLQKQVDALFDVLGVDTSHVDWEHDGRDRIAARLLQRSSASISGLSAGV